MSLMRPRVLAALLIVIAVLRIASTFTTFSQTTDESMHVGGGLEVLQDHTYQLMLLNPPLPRIVMAVLPYVAGVRLPENKEFWVRTHAVFYNQLPYETNLALARAGNLIFFALAATCVWLLTVGPLGARGALIAILLFTTQPIILGYSGLATHEAAATAAVGVGMIAFSFWMARPNARYAAILGVAYGFGVLCKFSSLVYIPAVCGAILVARLIETRDSRRLRAVPLTILIVLAVSAFVVWLGYGFNIRPFINGVTDISRLDREGMPSYLFGRWTQQGWWYYFPVALVLKTTLPFLFLFFAGFVATSRNSTLRRIFMESAAASIAILVVAMRSRLDIGVRYVLPVFIPMTIAAGAATMALLESRRAITRWCTVGLLLLQVVSSIAAHPDYFPYFNILTGNDPSRYLVDSNLDWEQDALRLRKVVRHLRIETLWVRGISSIDYEALHFPPVQRYNTPYEVLHGWVAVGDSYYREGRAAGGWPQLEGMPFRRVGKSIRLYQLP
jgi:4-amino-4-deoxy-L-arabinose transferase-like glycosyltransferase